VIAKGRATLDDVGLRTQRCTTCSCASASVPQKFGMPRFQGVLRERPSPRRAVQGVGVSTESKLAVYISSCIRSFVASYSRAYARAGRVYRAYVGGRLDNAILRMRAGHALASLKCPAPSAASARRVGRACVNSASAAASGDVRHNLEPYRVFDASADRHHLARAMFCAFEDFIVLVDAVTEPSRIARTGARGCGEGSARRRRPSPRGR
jgi:hypothetical protein